MLKLIKQIIFKKSSHQDYRDFLAPINDFKNPEQILEC